MVVALEHRHDRNELDHDEDAYSRSGDVPGMDVMSAGSVTSFVRKLFQMVQGECDSIVGFVADGTAFEVKDPRRLEQDILPKYFRHSRFQSLVRQLNFYSFKKISKERSVWIYKHAFFRRDEPELLHALKRKTNQHGVPARVGGGVAGLGVGGGGADDMMVVDRAAPIVGGSLSRDPLANNKARSHGLSFLPPRHADGGAGGAFRPPHHQHHHSPSFSNQHQEHHQHPPHYPHHHGSNGDRHSSRSSRPPHHPRPAHRKNGSSGSGRMYHASSSRGAGGGPSTGGAAVPSYGGQGPSSRGGAPGFAWAGAGGRPVSSSGGPGAEYDRRSGGVDGGSGMRATKAGEHRGFDDGRSSSSSSQAYSRQGPAIGDDRGSALGRQRGDGGGGGGGNGGPAAAAAGGGAGGGGVTNKDHALALFGLSALCQVASATEAPAAHKGSIGQVDEDGGGGSGGGGRGSRRLSDGVDRRQQKRHRGVGPEAEARSRRGWAVQESLGDEEREEEEEEDGATSAERDDSSMSNHRRSPSNSSCVSSSSSNKSLMSSADSSDGGFERHHHGSTINGVFVQPPPPPPTTTDAKTAVPRQQQQTSGSGGVFCPTWDWGRAACEPAMRLPGSFVDRRFEEVDQQVVKDDDDNDDDDVSSRAEEEERDEGESRQEFAQESDDEGPEARPDTSSTAHRRGEAIVTPDEASLPHVSVSFVGSDEPRPTPTAPVPPRPRDTRADMKAEADVGLEGIGAFFSHCCSAASGNDTTRALESGFLATVANSGDGGLREMAVFCAGPAGKAPDAAPAAYLAREVSLFLQSEEAVAEDLRVYAEALDPAAVDIVVEESLGSSSNPAAVTQPLSPDGGKLLRVFCRFAACRLGRALEVASLVAESAEEAATGGSGGGGDKAAEQQGLLLQRHGAFARRVAPQLDSCRWKWWRAAVRFS
ncbi:unnamed protein product [Ectocarpus sp. CCAP 1310/34]|nr:unnamed protein product [Ectocarpus sp. CCAP 1310/34]